MISTMSTLFSASNELHSHCEALSHVSYLNFGISLFILVGIVVSYLPQHVRIVLRKSSFGLSPYFVLLGMTSSTSQIGNILVLPGSRQDIACCHEIKGFACFAALLGIIQILTQWTCFAIILALFLIFFPRATPPTTHPDKDPSPTWRTAVTVTIVSVLHGAIVVAISVILVLTRPSALQGWANFLGITGTIFASVQYFPQIYTTFVLKRVGSLSIPMMLIQTPGSLLWAASLAARLGPEGWSAWGVYIITAILQGTLLVMGSYYELQHRRREKKAATDGAATESNEDHADTSEETPLLRSGTN